MSLSPATASLQDPITFAEGPMLRLSGLTESDKIEIRAMLTIQNPRRLQALRYTGWVDPKMPRQLFGYADLPDDSMMIAPGAGLSIWRWAKTRQRECIWQPMLRAPIDAYSLAYVGEGRGYQDEAVAQTAVRSAATVVGPCGSGKTDIGLRVMAMKGGKWLIIVHMRKLQHQWKERAINRVQVETGAAHCPGPASVSIYSTTRKKKWNPDADFVIATVQSLRRNGADVIALAGEGRGVWVDECHHTPCATFTDVLALGAWRCRYGVTATPYRTDGTTALMHWWIGPTAATVERAKVEDSGHLLRPRLVVLTSKYEDEYNPDEVGDSQRLMARLCDNTARLMMIVDAIVGLVSQGRHILVCVDRIAYGDAIRGTLMANRRVDAECCNAKISKSEQDRVMSEVASGQCRVVIATSLADEGLDLPILDTVVLATPSGSATRVEQRMGRASRPLVGKLEPIVVDIVDPLVKREVIDLQTGETRIHRMFVNQFRARYNKVYRTMAHCDTDAVRRILRGDANGEYDLRSSAT